MTHPCAPSRPACSSPQPQPCQPHEAYCQSQHSDHCGGYGDDWGHPSLSLSVDLDVNVALDFGHDCAP